MGADEKQPLNEQQVIDALDVKRGLVHTYVNPAPNMLIGADWDLEDVIEAVRDHGAEVAGDFAQTMRHGVAVVRPKQGAVFFATREGWEPGKVGQP